MGTVAASSQAKVPFPLSCGWRLVVTIAKCLGTSGRGQVQGKKLTNDGALSREGRDPGPYPGATSPGHWRSQYIRHVLPSQAPTAEGWHQGQEPGARPRFHALSERLGEFSPTPEQAVLHQLICCLESDLPLAGTQFPSNCPDKMHPQNKDQAITPL